MTEFDEDNIRPIDRVRNISRMLFFLFIFLLGIKGLGNGFSLLGGDLLDNIFQAMENPFLGLIVGVLTTSMVQSSSVTTSLIVGLVAALKDPLSGNLDRIQIVKGWVDSRGERHEKVYDVAWSGERSPGPDGKLPPVGNTVDVATATWTNSIGSAELITAWTDPDFDPKLRAVYYARVLEIPTPRWTAYEAVRFGIDMPSPNVPMTTQERAYTSPIWYTP